MVLWLYQVLYLVTSVVQRTICLGCRWPFSKLMRKLAKQIGLFYMIRSTGTNCLPSKFHLTDFWIGKILQTENLATTIHHTGEPFIVVDLSSSLSSLLIF